MHHLRRHSPTEDHVPLFRHWTVTGPSISKPSIHTYRTVEFTVKLNVERGNPLLIAFGGLQVISMQKYMIYNNNNDKN